MHIIGFSAEGFRNLKHVQFSPDEKLNLIIGDNAQGKTNLLDAIWLMTGCKNFHGVKERHYLGFDAEFFRCACSFSDGRRIQEILCTLQRGQQKKKLISINGVENQKANALFELFHCVAFSPADLNLITGTPDKRRAFMDLCACQLHSGAVQHVSRANVLLAQRNACLQKALQKRLSGREITLFDEALAKEAVYVMQLRSEYVKHLAPLCGRLYGIITGGKESLILSYRNNLNATMSLSDPSTAMFIQEYQKMLAEHLEEDCRVGYTQKGIQRDDLQLTINGKSVQQFGSQGQKKSVALVLRLAQAHLYHEKQKRSPVVLLDDVMGELDEKRQKLLYETISDMQVFITLCNASALKLDQKAKLFHMQDGVLTG